MTHATDILGQFSLEGKTALVTGGAGLYGRQIVAALAEAGARTLVASRDVAALEKATEEHRARHREVSVLQLDQGDEISTNKLRDTVGKRHGAPDILVNNAVLRPMTSSGYQGADAGSAFARSMQVNATGLFLVTRAFADLMAEDQDKLTGMGPHLRTPVPEASIWSPGGGTTGCCGA